MVLEPGAALSHYRLVEKIGAGGMGEVWRASDTNLERDVAIKILPDVFAKDAERLSRFEREAKLLASLNHPGIAVVHGLHEQDGMRYLAMELVPGDDLSVRLGRGPLRVEEALFVCLQVAEALEAAHAQGVIHRDLKPANVVLTPDGKAKVLDFGLAKAIEADPSSSDASHSHSPTVTSGGTVAGVILGTAAYMSPEQARGRPVDKRTDIWSFGCVLFECLTGNSFYKGESVSDSIGAILHKEPDWSLLPEGTPPAIHLLLRRCLTKEANNRLQDIGDARIELQAAIADPTSSALNLASAALTAAAPRRRASLAGLLPWGLVALLLAAVAVIWWVSRPEPLPVTRLSLLLENEQARPIGPIALAPDGRTFAFAQPSTDGLELRTRALGQLETTPVPNVSYGAQPFFSPDGQWLGYEWNDKVKKVSMRGGPPSTICEAPDLRGAAWGPDGTIVLATHRGKGLFRVLAAGGEPEPLTELDEGLDEGTVAESHGLPSFLPDGEAVLFTAEGDWDEKNAIMVHDLGSGETKLLIRNGIQPRYAATGHVVFYRDGTLMAAPFDDGRLELTGPAVPVLEGVARAWFGAAYALSDEGTLAYVPGTGDVMQSTLVWRDDAGREQPLTELKREFTGLRLSPDGRRVAVTIEEDSKEAIRILELDRDVLRPLTFDEGDVDDPVWSPDGRWIAFSSKRDGGNSNIYRIRTDFTGEPERLTTSENDQRPASWSPDGTMLAFMQDEEGRETDIYLLRFDDDGEPVGDPEPFATRPADEFLPAFSRDSRWIAYNSNESGRLEVYVRPASGPGGAVQVSTERGFMPRFSPAGDKIFYLWVDRLVSVDYRASEGEFTVSPPDRAFDIDPATEVWRWGFDIAPDGRRFAFGISAEPTSGSRTPVVVLNWFEELREKTAQTGR